MRLFSNGCSFLTPRPKDGVDTYVAEILAGFYKDDLYNMAMGGRGNDRISFTTKLWFEQNGYTDTFAIIGWSSSLRNDYVTNDGWKKGRIPNTETTWRTWKVSDQLRFVNANPGWDIEVNASMRFVDHVMDLQSYFKLNNIPYIMYNALPNSITGVNKDILKLSSALDKKRFFQIDNSHYDYVIKNKLIVSPSDPHPSTDGHMQWATQLTEFIDANDLRTI